MRDKYLTLKRIPFLVFLLITLILLIVDSENFTILLIISLLTIIPLGLQMWHQNEFFKSDKFQQITNVFYFSIFFLYIGYFFGIVYHSNQSPEFFTNGLALATVVAIYALMMLGIFVSWAISKSDLADKFYETIKSNENLAIKDFLKIAKEKEANILAVAGNLKSLNSKKGLEFLKDFLKDNPVNKLELFIPLSAKSILTELKNNFNDNELSKRVEINVVEPFVFLQGIVFAGQQIQSQSIPLTKGYYLYKPIVQKGDNISKGGVFVDVSMYTDENDDYSIAIGAYYNHLKNKNYPINGYEFKPGIFTKLDNAEHNHIKETFTLETV